MVTKYKLLIIYDSISGNTERMAKYVVEGVKSEITDVSIKKVDEIEEQDLVQASAIVFGCPTYNRDLTSGMKKFFETTIVKLKNDLKGKPGAAFGSYGWSGESISLMKETMKYLKMKIIDIPQEFTGAPDEDFYLTSLSDIKERSLKLGKDLAKKIKILQK